MRKRTLRSAGALLVAGLVFTACADGSDQSSAAMESSQQQLIAAHGLENMDAVEVIDHLDRVPLAERSTELMAAVLPDRLVLSSETEEFALELPEDSFYLSIAPFVNYTHECYYHSLTTCVGELSEEDVHVTIIDDSGEVLVDEQRTTFDNGFVGVWVPTGTSGTIEIDYADMTGSTEFATDAEAATCITDLQLS